MQTIRRVKDIRAAMPRRTPIAALATIWCLTVLCAFGDAATVTTTTTIQDAIDDAGYGGTVNIPAGTYSGTGNSDVVINWPVTIKGVLGADLTPAVVVEDAHWLVSSYVFPRKGSKVGIERVEQSSDQGWQGGFYFYGHGANPSVNCKKASNVQWYNSACKSTFRSHRFATSGALTWAGHQYIPQVTYLGRLYMDGLVWLRGHYFMTGHGRGLASESSIALTDPIPSPACSERDASAHCHIDEGNFGAALFDSSHVDMHDEVKVTGVSDAYMDVQLKDSKPPFGLFAASMKKSGEFPASNFVFPAGSCVVQFKRCTPIPFVSSSTTTPTPYDAIPAIKIVGTSNYVRKTFTGSSFTASSEFTVSFWCHWKGSASGQMFKYTSSGEKIFISRDADSVLIRVGGQLLTASTKVLEEVWQHLAFTWTSDSANAGRTAIFVEGALAATGTTYVSAFGSSGDVEFMHPSSGADHMYAGHLKIFSAARTPGEIAFDMFNYDVGTAAGGSGGPLIVFLAFEEVAVKSTTTGCTNAGGDVGCTGTGGKAYLLGTDRSGENNHFQAVSASIASTNDADWMCGSTFPVGEGIMARGFLTHDFDADKDLSMLLRKDHSFDRDDDRGEAFPVDNNLELRLVAEEHYNVGLNSGDDDVIDIHDFDDTGSSNFANPPKYKMTDNAITVMPHLVSSLPYVPAWDLSSEKLYYEEGPRVTLGKDYTIMLWVHWSGTGWVDFFSTAKTGVAVSKSSDDGTTTVVHRYSAKGSCSNYACSYPNTVSPAYLSDTSTKWKFYAITGEGSSNTDFAGTSTFYEGGNTDVTVTQYGTTTGTTSTLESRATTFCGTEVRGFGPQASSSSGFKLSEARVYNRKLTLGEINAYHAATFDKHHGNPKASPTATNSFRGQSAFTSRTTTGKHGLYNMFLASTINTLIEPNADSDLHNMIRVYPLNASRTRSVQLIDSCAQYSPCSNAPIGQQCDDADQQGLTCCSSAESCAGTWPHMCWLHHNLADSLPAGSCGRAKAYDTASACSGPYVDMPYYQPARSDDGTSDTYEAVTTREDRIQTAESYRMVDIRLQGQCSSSSDYATFAEGTGLSFPDASVLSPAAKWVGKSWRVDTVEPVVGGQVQLVAQHSGQQIRARISNPGKSVSMFRPSQSGDFIAVKQYGTSSGKSRVVFAKEADGTTLSDSESNLDPVVFMPELVVLAKPSIYTAGETTKLLNDDGFVLVCATPGGIVQLAPIDISGGSTAVGARRSYRFKNPVLASPTGLMTLMAHSSGPMPLYVPKSIYDGETNEVVIENALFRATSSSANTDFVDSRTPGLLPDPLLRIGHRVYDATGRLDMELPFEGNTQLKYCQFEDSPGGALDVVGANLAGGALSEVKILSNKFTGNWKSPTHWRNYESSAPPALTCTAATSFAPRVEFLASDHTGNDYTWTSSGSVTGVFMETGSITKKIDDFGVASFLFNEYSDPSKDGDASKFGVPVNYDPNHDELTFEVWIKMTDEPPAHSTSQTFWPSPRTYYRYIISTENGRNTDDLSWPSGGSIPADGEGHANMESLNDAWSWDPGIAIANPQNSGLNMGWWPYVGPAMCSGDLTSCKADTQTSGTQPGANKKDPKLDPSNTDEGNKWAYDLNNIDKSTLNGPVVANAWTHIVASYSKTADPRALYINGIEVPYSHPEWDFLTSCSKQFWVGGHHSSPYFANEEGHSSSFSLSKLRVWNRKLVTVEIMALFAQGPGVAPSRMHKQDQPYTSGGSGTKLGLALGNRAVTESRSTTVADGRCNFNAQGGAIRLSNTSAPITDTVAHDNYVHGSGGFLYAENSFVTAERSVIRNNGAGFKWAEHGAGTQNFQTGFKRFFGMDSGLGSAFHIVAPAASFEVIESEVVDHFLGLCISDQVQYEDCNPSSSNKPPTTACRGVNVTISPLRKRPKWTRTAPFPDIIDTNAADISSVRVLNSSAFEVFDHIYYGADADWDWPTSARIDQLFQTADSSVYRDTTGKYSTAATISASDTYVAGIEVEMLAENSKVLMLSSDALLSQGSSSVWKMNALMEVGSEDTFDWKGNPVSRYPSSETATSIYTEQSVLQVKMRNSKVGGKIEGSSFDFFRCDFSDADIVMPDRGDGPTQNQINIFGPSRGNVKLQSTCTACTNTIVNISVVDDDPFVNKPLFVDGLIMGDAVSGAAEVVSRSSMPIYVSGEWQFGSHVTTKMKTLKGMAAGTNLQVSEQATLLNVDLIGNTRLASVSNKDKVFRPTSLMSIASENADVSITNCSFANHVSTSPFGIGEVVKVDNTGGVTGTDGINYVVKWADSVLFHSPLDAGGAPDTFSVTCDVASNCSDLRGPSGKGGRRSTCMPWITQETLSSGHFVTVMNVSATSGHAALRYTGGGVLVPDNRARDGGLSSDSQMRALTWIDSDPMLDSDANINFEVVSFETPEVSGSKLTLATGKWKNSLWPTATTGIWTSNPLVTRTVTADGTMEFLSSSYADGVGALGDANYVMKCGDLDDLDGVTADEGWMIRVTMGNVEDFFRPKNTALSYCDMMRSGANHKWNPLGGHSDDWLPVESENGASTDSHLGGSAKTFDYTGATQPNHWKKIVEYKDTADARVTSSHYTNGVGSDGDNLFVTPCTEFDHLTGRNWSIRVTMGSAVDYFKPKDTTVSVCDLLTSNDKHKWSPHGWEVSSRAVHPSEDVVLDHLYEVPGGAGDQTCPVAWDCVPTGTLSSNGAPNSHPKHAYTLKRRAAAWQYYSGVDGRVCPPENDVTHSGTGKKSYNQDGKWTPSSIASRFNRWEICSNPANLPNTPVDDATLQTFCDTPSSTFAAKYEKSVEWCAALGMTFVEVDGSSVTRNHVDQTCPSESPWGTTCNLGIKSSVDTTTPADTTVYSWIPDISAGAPVQCNCQGATAGSCPTPGAPVTAYTGTVIGCPATPPVNWCVNEPQRMDTDTFYTRFRPSDNCMYTIQPATLDANVVKNHVACKQSCNAFAAVEKALFGGSAKGSNGADAREHLPFWGGDFVHSKSKGGCCSESTGSSMETGDLDGDPFGRAFTIEIINTAFPVWTRPEGVDPTTWPSTASDDVRHRLSTWGKGTNDPATRLGGCCSSDKSQNNQGWGQPFHVDIMYIKHRERVIRNPSRECRVTQHTGGVVTSNDPSRAVVWKSPPNSTTSSAVAVSSVTVQPDGQPVVSINDNTAVFDNPRGFLPGDYVVGSSGAYQTLSEVGDASATALYRFHGFGAGGAINAASGTKLTLHNTPVTGNTAQSACGGGIFMDSTPAVFVRELHTVKSVRIESSGKVRFPVSGGQLFTVTWITSPSADNTEPFITRIEPSVSGLVQLSDGNSFYNLVNESPSTLTSTLGPFTHNQAEDGGAICAANGSVVSIVNTVMSHNRAVRHGGALSFATSATTELTDNVLTNNTAGMDGGAIHWSAGGSGVTISRCVLSANTATGGRGGAVHAETLQVVTISDCPLDNNKAGSDGGAVHSVGSLDLRSSTANNNSAGANGGAVSVLGGSAVSIGPSVTVRYNQAVGDGGGVAVSSNGTGSAVVVNGVPIDSNSAGGHGGGLMLGLGVASAIVSGQSGGAQLLGASTNGASMSGNTAGQNGGAIDSAYGTRIELIGVTMNNNKAGQDGGAVRLAGGSDCFLTAGTVLQGNSAGDIGGHFSIVEGSTLTSTTSTLDKGAALVGGSCMFIDATSSAAVEFNSGNFDCGHTTVLPGGQLSWNTSASQQCPAGYYVPTVVSMMSCVPADPGRYADGVNEHVCPSGEHTPTAGNAACMVCQAGTFAGQSVLGGSMSCNLCAPGQYSESGSTVCADCAPGTSAPSSGTSACLACEAGTAADAPGSVDCDGCVAGFSQPNSGQKECAPCPPGTAQPNRSFAVCAGCEPGHYQPEAGQPRCIPCPVGSRQPLVGQSQCSSCGAGSFQPFERASECLQCPHSYFQLEAGASLCYRNKRKPNASFQLLDHPRTYNSIPCPVGIICNDYDLVGVQAGFWIPEFAAATSADSTILLANNNALVMDGLDRLSRVGRNGCYDRVVNTSTNASVAEREAEFIKCMASYSCMMHGCAGYLWINDTAGAREQIDDGQTTGCHKGYVGPLCGLCAGGFFRFKFDCLACPSFGASLSIAIAGSMLVGGILIVLFGSDPHNSVLMPRYKAFLAYSQIASKLGQSLPLVAWPAFLTTFWHQLELLNLDLDSVFGGAAVCLGYTSAVSVWRRVVTASIGPIVLIMVLYLPVLFNPKAKAAAANNSSAVGSAAGTSRQGQEEEEGAAAAAAASNANNAADTPGRNVSIPEALELAALSSKADIILQMPMSVVEMVNDAFDTLDTSGDGKMDAPELTKALSILGFEVNSEEIDVVFDLLGAREPKPRLLPVNRPLPATTTEPVLSAELVAAAEIVEEKELEPAGPSLNRAQFVSLVEAIVHVTVDHAKPTFDFHRGLSEITAGSGSLGSNQLHLHDGHRSITINDIIRVAGACHMPTITKPDARQMISQVKKMINSDASVIGYDEYELLPSEFLRFAANAVDADALVVPSESWRRIVQALCLDDACLFTTGSALWAIQKRKAQWAAANRRSLAAVFVLTPNIVSTLVSAFPCEPTIGGSPAGMGEGRTTFLLADYSILCDSEEHNSLRSIAGPGLFLYAVVVPIALLAALLLNRNRLWSHKTFDRYGFLYGSYTDQAYWFDAWQIFRKIVMASAIVVVFPGDMMQLVVFIAFSTVSLVLNLQVKPYKNPVDNTLHTTGEVCLIITAFYALVLKGRDTVFQTSPEWDELRSYGVFALNICTFLPLLLVPLFTIIKAQRDKALLKRERTMKDARLLDAGINNGPRSPGAGPSARNKLVTLQTSSRIVNTPGGQGGADGTVLNHVQAANKYRDDLVMQSLKESSGGNALALDMSDSDDFDDADDADDFDDKNGAGAVIS